MWITSLLLELNYKFIIRSLAFSLGYIYILKSLVCVESGSKFLLFDGMILKMNAKAVAVLGTGSVKI